MIHSHHDLPQTALLSARAPAEHEIRFPSRSGRHSARTQKEDRT